MLQSIIRPTPWGLSASLCRSLSTSTSSSSTPSIALRITRAISSPNTARPFPTRQSLRFSSTSTRPLPSKLSPSTSPSPFKRYVTAQSPTSICFFSTTSAAAAGRMFPPDRRWTSPKPSSRKPRSNNEVVPAREEEEPVHQVEKWEKKEEPEWVKYYRQRAQLSDAEVPPENTTLKRLLPSLLFTFLVLAASTVFAFTYKPPPQKDRWLPDTPQSLATIGGIIAFNTAIFFLWKFPPLWRFMNKNFIIIPATPHAFSMLGAVFSHQQFSHLAANMLVLFLWGATFCDQIGRGNFLAMYCSAGAVASFGSLAFNVLRGNLHISALGASGAVFGMMGAFAYLNPDYKFRFLLFPFFDITAIQAVTAAATIEAVSWATNFMPNIDRVAHLSGLAAGVVFMWMIYERSRRKREQMREELTRKFGR